MKMEEWYGFKQIAADTNIHGTVQIYSRCFPTYLGEVFCYPMIDMFDFCCPYPFCSFVRPLKPRDKRIKIGTQNFEEVHFFSTHCGFVLNKQLSGVRVLYNARKNPLTLLQFMMRIV